MKPVTKILFAALLACGVSSAFADVTDRHLTGFKAVALSSSVDVYITQGSSESVKVEAPGDMQDKIITEVDGGTLKIRNRDDKGFNWDNWFGDHKKIVVYVSLKEVNAITISGSGDIYFKDGLNTNSLKLRVSGSGDVSGKVTTKSLETSISGSGDIRLSGHAETSTVSVVGSGDFRARDLTTGTTMVRVSGSGDATINATERIDASVAGSGDVHYSGSPKKVSKSTAGSGEIHGS